MNVVIQKIEDNNIIVIPKNILEKLNLKVNDILEIKMDDNQIVIEKKREKYSRFI